MVFKKNVDNINLVVALKNDGRDLLLLQNRNDMACVLSFIFNRKFYRKVFSGIEVVYGMGQLV